MSSVTGVLVASPALYAVRLVTFGRTTSMIVLPTTGALSPPTPWLLLAVMTTKPGWPVNLTLPALSTVATLPLLEAQVSSVLANSGETVAFTASPFSVASPRVIVLSFKPESSVMDCTAGRLTVTSTVVVLGVSPGTTPGAVMVTVTFLASVSPRPSTCGVRVPSAPTVRVFSSEDLKVTAWLAVSAGATLASTL